MKKEQLDDSVSCVFLCLFHTVEQIGDILLSFKYLYFASFILGV